MLVRNEQEGKDYLYNLIDTPGILLLFPSTFQVMLISVTKSIVPYLPAKAYCFLWTPLKAFRPKPLPIIALQKRMYFFYFPPLLNIIAFGCGSRHYQN